MEGIYTIRQGNPSEMYYHRVIFELFNDTAPKTCEKYVFHSELEATDPNVQLSFSLHWRTGLVHQRKCFTLQGQHHPPLN